MKLPPKLGPIHFIGIGGIGMSGIAEVMHNLGYTVQGSDAADNYNVKRLDEKGIRTFVGHRPRTWTAPRSSWSRPRSSATTRNSSSAREKRLPVVRRAEMLAELMRFKSCVAIAGTHGKTTTTSLVATLLDAGGLDPTVINGGIINAYGTNARMGDGPVDGGGGRRVGRHVPEAAGRRRDRHQYRPRAPRPFRVVRRRSRTPSAPSSRTSRSTASR